jgi:hypothetical protein
MSIVDRRGQTPGGEDRCRDHVWSRGATGEPRRGLRIGQDLGSGFSTIFSLKLLMASLVVPIDVAR